MASLATSSLCVLALGLVLVGCSGGSGTISSGGGPSPSGGSERDSTTTVPDPAPPKKQTPPEDGTSNGTNDPSSPSTNGTTTIAACMQYATTYCGCLGSSATANCVSQIQTGCEDGFDICPGGYAAHASCVVSKKCAMGWLDACKLDSTKC
jgi:hypothetical protein